MQRTVGLLTSLRVYSCDLPSLEQHGEFYEVTSFGLPVKRWEHESEEGEGGERQIGVQSQNSLSASRSFF